MSWSRRRVGHLLHLKLLRLNGTWDRYGAERMGDALRPWPPGARTAAPESTLPARKARQWW